MKKFEKRVLIENGHISAEKKYYPDNRVGNHSHDFFEFEYIVTGDGNYCIDGVDYKIKEKTMFFMTPVNFHNVTMKNTVFYNVMFSADMCDIGKLSSLFSMHPTVLSVDENTDEFLRALLNELCTFCNHTEYASMLLGTIIMKLCQLTVEKKEYISYDIRKCELYILDNFRKRLTLADVAKYAALSESHFSRKFLSETGQNFKHYVDSIRYDYAKKLLLYSDLNVMQICQECGFEDYPNFVRRFKMKTGFSPLGYRKSFY